LRAVEPLALGQHFGQPVQGLRAEHDVDVGRARDDGVALLAGHAAADADLHAARLQVLDAAQVGEHLLLCLLAHRAGVEQDQVGLVDVLRRLVALGRVEHVGHLVRVVLVHLAAEGFDEDFLGGHGELFYMGGTLVSRRAGRTRGFRGESGGACPRKECRCGRWPLARYLLRVDRVVLHEGPDVEEGLVQRFAAGGGFVGREDPDLAQHAGGIARVVDQQVLARDRAAHHQHVLAAADARAGREPVGAAVEHHVVAVDHAELAAQGADREIAPADQRFVLGLRPGHRVLRARLKRKEAGSGCQRCAGCYEMKSVRGCLAAVHGVHPEAVERGILASGVPVHRCLSRPFLPGAAPWPLLFFTVRMDTRNPPRSNSRCQPKVHKNP
uniref:Phenol hydroxylase n=1 Tax=Brugia timori TaxID=42155 RepID=A0A0R3QG56_9BILA